MIRCAFIAFCDNLIDLYGLVDYIRCIERESIFRSKDRLATHR